MQPPSDESAIAAADVERERLLAAIPHKAQELLVRFEIAVRAEERKRLALEFAELRSMPSVAMSDAVIGTALAAEANSGPLAYCGPEEMMRLLIASFDEDTDA